MGAGAIAALIAAIAGAAMQYKASSDAAKRSDRATMEALRRQQDLQMQAEKKAMDTAKEFKTEDRAAEQNVIEAELNQEFMKPVESAQQINNSTSTTQGAVSDDYVKAKAASNAEQMKNAAAFAKLMAKTTAAGRLRTNEAVKLADTAAGIDRLGSFSRGQAGADQVAIGVAGRPDAGLQFAGQVASAVGSMGMSGGGMGNISQVGTEGINLGGMAGVIPIAANGFVPGKGLGFKAPKSSWDGAY